MLNSQTVNLLPLLAFVFTLVGGLPLVFSQDCFETKEELQTAIQSYIDAGENAPTSAVATQYGHPIGTWCTSLVDDFSGLFQNQRTFNEALNGWDTRAVTDMTSCFDGASLFWGDISSWDVSSVTSFHKMFYQAFQFTGDLSRWQTGSAQDMSFMFADATGFQNDISNWDVSKVTTFESMFSAATNFNNDISTWDVSSGTNFKDMFARRAGFRYSLCTWGPAIQKTQQQLNTVDVSNMFSIYDPTSTNCPRYNDPDLTSYPPGPFCYSCGGGQGTAEDFEGGTATTTTTNNNDEQVNTNDNDNGGESNVPVNDRPSNAGVLRCTKNNHVLFLVLGIVAMVWMF